MVGQREYRQRQRPYGILYPGFFFWEFHDAECTSADRISSFFLRLAILTLGKGKHANVIHLLHLQMLPDSVVLSAARRFRTTFSAALRTARRRGDQLCFQRWALDICHEISIYRRLGILESVSERSESLRKCISVCFW